MSTDPFESYKLYNALKLHFESDSYDAIKYNFKTSVKAQSFFKRKDKYFFAKIANNHSKDIMQFYIANFKVGLSYVGDMIDDAGNNNYTEHKRIVESIHRVFSVDINNILDELEKSSLSFDDCLTADSNDYPLIVKMMMRDDISMETVVIINALTGFISREDSKITETILWPDVKRKIVKYSPFVRYDRQKCVNMLKKVFTPT